VLAECHDDTGVLSLTRPVVNTPYLALQSLSPSYSLLVWHTPGEEESLCAQVGRDAKTERFMSVKDAQRRKKTAVVETFNKC